MKVISFIEGRQQELIERILRDCSLWEAPIRTLANSRGPPMKARGATAAACELEFVPDPEFLEFQRVDSQPVNSRELQLVIDPEYL
jgi:hypothetical protein